MSQATALTRGAKEPLAARWMGQFHAVAAERLTNVPIPVLNKYDRDYYLGWARRTSQFASYLHGRFPWLAILCHRFEEFVDSLLMIPATVIHGEYYAKNLLFRGGMAYPVDWESAAIAFGEIDLAAFTEGPWPAKIVQQCKSEYQQARWSEKHPG